jgi:hypothetical protein
LKSRRRSPKDSYKVFVEVHQNGELLSKTSKPFNKKGSITLTSNPYGELTAPFYPLPTDIKILKITQRGVEVDLDPNWEGFTTCEGKIEDINSDRKSAYTHIMKKGDYGSIAFNDLRVLIRIGKDRRAKRELASLSREYRGALSELWIGEKREFKFVALGFFVALWLMGGFTLGLLYHPDNRPRNFIDLRLEYTLPFIDPRHLRWAPESMQAYYDRVAPIPSVLSFVQAFTDTLLGFEALRGPRAEQRAIFPETRDRYADVYRQHRQTLDQIDAQRVQKEQRVLEDGRNALVSVPVIRGESFAGSLLRLEDKLQIWYESTEKTHSMRRAMTEAFTQDRLYDFHEYRDLKKVARPDIRSSVDPRDEEAMYKEAQKLAATAGEHRERLLRYRERVAPLSPSNASPLALPVDSQTLSFRSRADFDAFNRKLGMIQAALFDPEKPKIIREPLIGTLDPKLIQQTIERYRFELQLCYELALRRNQQATGSMEWQWHLDTQGQVYDIELMQSGIDDSKMIECVRSKIQTWKWPRPQKGSIRISFPFHFKPAKG